MSDWDAIHAGMGDIHRGMVTSLPDHVHAIVHDESRPVEERARHLLRAVSNGAEGTTGGLGSHWTTDDGVAESFAHDSGHADDITEKNKRHAMENDDRTHGVNDFDEPAGKPATAVLFHAHKPEREDIDDAPDPFDHSSAVMFDYDHAEQEVPLRPGAPVRIKGISWRPVHHWSDEPDDFNDEYTRHDFHEPQHHHAHTRQPRVAALTFASWMDDDEEYPSEEEHAEQRTKLWDDIHSGLDEIHRGLGAHLHPSVHRIVHDKSRPVAERAHLLLREIAKGDPQRRWDGHGLGTHWTSDKGVAESFGEKGPIDLHISDSNQKMTREKNHLWGTDEDGRPKAQPGTAVVLHAHPDRESIDENPDEFAHGSSSIYDYHDHGEREVPLHPGASVRIKGISWRQVHDNDEDNDDEEYTRHDFGEEQYHQAARIVASWDEDDEPQPGSHIDCPDFPGHHEDEISEWSERECPYEGHHTDWSRYYPQVGDTIHRGMGINLHDTFHNPVHDTVHDKSRPLHERAHALLNLVKGENLGTHWTDDQEQAEDYAHKEAHDPYHEAPATKVVFHAHKPDLEHIEQDPDQLKAGGVIGYDVHDDAEIPLQHNAPVKIKGVSWAHKDTPEDWQHYELPEGHEHQHHIAYTRRTCEQCGSGMQPYHPRTTVGDKLMCPMCAQNEGHRMAGKMTRVAVRHRQGELNLATAPPEQGLAHFIAADQPNLLKLAHDSGDSMTIFHCPFCGSGQVIARSDGSVECEFCHSSFTVQVQPEFSAFPQTINGVPVDVPGMGPDQMPQDGQQPAPMDEEGAPPFAGGDDPDQDGDDDSDPEGDDEDGGDEQAPPFGKKSYRTASGAELSEDAFLKHIAIATARNRPAVISRVRAANRRS